MDKPTDAQLRYARAKGLEVSPGMSKQDVSAILDRFEQQNPKAARNRHRINRWRADKERKEFEEACGPDLLVLLDEWENYSRENNFLLVVYRRGKRILIDVVEGVWPEIYGAKTKKLRLYCQTLKVVDDKIIGEYVTNSKAIQVPIEKLLYHEPASNMIAGVTADGAVAAFERAMNRGMHVVINEAWDEQIVDISDESIDESLNTYLVRGAYARTGNNVTLTIMAATEKEAEKEVLEHGVYISSITLIPD